MKNTGDDCYKLEFVEEYELVSLHDSTVADGAFCPCLPVGDENFFIEISGKNGC